jgi:hypothetical protein
MQNKISRRIVMVPIEVQKSKFNNWLTSKKLQKMWIRMWRLNFCHDWCF